MSSNPEVAIIKAPSFGKTVPSLLHSRTSPISESQNGDPFSTQEDKDPKKSSKWNRSLSERKMTGNEKVYHSD